MVDRRRLSGWLAGLVVACSRGAPVATEDAPDAGPAPGDVPDVPVHVAPAPPLPGDGPFYKPDRAGKAVGMLRYDAPNILYAGLDRESCEAELARRGIAVEHAPETRDVVTPVWLRGPLHGVAVHSSLPPKERLRAPTEIFDCRLVLAIDDFAALLADRDVVEIVHMSAHRPRKQNGCTAKARGLQHCGGLALDVASFMKKDGTVLRVERDFHGRIPVSTCAGAAKPRPPSRAATELWSFVCDAAARGLFHVILTPNTNRDHKNHFHLEITPGVAWMLIH